MRNSWLVGLATCAMAAFSACSTNENEVKPVNPVTEYTVPATAEIGGGLEVKGKGFDSSAQIFLKSMAGTETMVNDLVTTATEAKFNIPSTLTAGVYTVVLKQQGSWDLGQVRLAVAQNPILNLLMPSAIKLNKALEIGGIGFTSASKVFLETTDAAKTRTELATTLDASGVSCTIPSSVAAGSYNVILKHNNIDWVLAENVPTAVYKRLVSFKQVSESKADGAAFDAAYEANKEDLAGMGIESKEDLLAAIAMSSTITERYVFNNDQLTSIMLNSGEGEKEAWSFTYPSNVLTGENKLFDAEYGGLKTFSLAVSNGRVESNYVLNIRGGVEKPATYNWNYDADGYCATLNSATSGKEIKTFVYVDNNLTGISLSTPLKYTAQSKANNIFAPDAAQFLLNPESVEAFVKVANILGLTGKSSAKLPATIAGENSVGEEVDMPLTWTLNADGYATSVEWSGKGLDGAFDMFPMVLTNKYEFIYE